MSDEILPDNVEPPDAPDPKPELASREPSSPSIGELIGRSSWYIQEVLSNGERAQLRRTCEPGLTTYRVLESLPAHDEFDQEAFEPSWAHLLFQLAHLRHLADAKGARLGVGLARMRYGDGRLERLMRQVPDPAPMDRLARRIWRARQPVQWGQAAALQLLGAEAREAVKRQVMRDYVREQHRQHTRR